MKELFKKYVTKDNLIYLGIISLIFLTVLSLVSFTPVLSAIILTGIISYLIYGNNIRLKIYRKKG